MGKKSEKKIEPVENNCSIFEIEEQYYE